MGEAKGPRGKKAALENRQHVAGMSFCDPRSLAGARLSRVPLSEGRAADGQRFVSNFSLNQFQNTKRRKQPCCHSQL